jgi:hypothetical protein
MPRGFKEELAYIEALTKKIEASEAELDENSDEEEKQTIANAKESLEERKGEFLDDLKELRQSQKAKEETAAKPKKAAPVKKQSNSAEAEVAIPESESEKKEGIGIAGFVCRIAQKRQRRPLHSRQVPRKAKVRQLDMTQRARRADDDNNDDD